MGVRDGSPYPLVVPVFTPPPHIEITSANSCPKPQDANTHQLSIEAQRDWLLTSVYWSNLTLWGLELSRSAIPFCFSFLLILCPLLLLLLLLPPLLLLLCVHARQNNVQGSCSVDLGLFHTPLFWMLFQSRYLLVSKTKKEIIKYSQSGKRRK